MICLAFFNVAQAQSPPVFIDTDAIANNVRQTLFGTPNLNLGATTIQTFDGQFPLGTLTYKVRECANNQTWQPIDNFKLVTSTGAVQGIKTYSSGEYIVSFILNETIPLYTLRSYAMYADIGSYMPGFTPYENRQCFRMALERSGIQTNANSSRKDPVFTGNFPIRLQAHTLVTTKPSVQILARGPSINRIRQTVDEPFLLRILNGPENLWVKDLAFTFSGGVIPTGTFNATIEIIEATTNSVAASGLLNFNGNVVWTQVVSGLSWQHSVISPYTVREFKIRVNSSGFNNTPGTSDSLSVQINPCDLQWDTEIGNAGGPGLCLEPSVVPLTSTVSYE